MRLLQELATAFPETRGWMKARIGSSGYAIQAYQRLIRESAAPFEKRDYIRYRDMPRALRGAESALDYLMKMEEGSDVTQNIDFCWMVIRETMRILDNGDDSDGRAGGVIEKCVEYLEKLCIQHILPSDNQAREKYFAQLLGKLQTHVLDNGYEWNVRVVEQCARIADLLPSLRERLLQYQRGRLDAAEMKEKALRAYVRGAAQKDYYRMLL